MLPIRQLAPHIPRRWAAQQLALVEMRAPACDFGATSSAQAPGNTCSAPAVLQPRLPTRRKEREEITSFPHASEITSFPPASRFLILNGEG